MDSHIVRFCRSAEYNPQIQERIDSPVCKASKTMFMIRPNQSIVKEILNSVQ